MTTETMNRYWRVAEISAPVAMSGDEFLEAAIKALGVWGGMSSSIKRTDELEVSISFDPETANGGLAAVVAWMDAFDIEYSLTVRRFAKDAD